MKLIRDRRGVYTPAFCFLVFCAVTLRTVALFIGYDTVTGYYTTVLGKVADVFSTVSVLFFLSYALVYRKDTGHEISFSSPSAYVPAGIVASALPFLSKQLFATAAGAQDVARTLPMRVTAVLCAFLAIPAMLFFLLCILVPRTVSKIRGECGILTALAFALYAAYLYFGTALPINAPGKLTEQCAYLLIAIFFLYETRIALGRECRPLYSAFGFAAAYLAAYTSLPALIFYFAKDLVVTDSLPAAVLTFGLFLFIFLRVLLAGRRDEATQTPLTDTLFALAVAREEAVAEKGPLPYDILEAEKNDPKHLPADIFADLSQNEEQEPATVSDELLPGDAGEETTDKADDTEATLVPDGLREIPDETDQAPTEKEETDEQ